MLSGTMRSLGRGRYTAARFFLRRKVFRLPLRKLAQNEIRSIFRLPEQCGNDFFECLHQTGIRVWHLALYPFMQLWQGVKRDHGEEIMFNVVIHVEVEKTENG